MVLDKQSLKAMFLGAARVWQENAAHLSEIDSRFGDGDHGVTIGKIAALLELPLSTVLSKYSRSLKKLRKQLEGDVAL